MRGLTLFPFDPKATHPFREYLWPNASMVSGKGGRSDFHQWCALDACLFCLQVSVLWAEFAGVAVTRICFYVLAAEHLTSRFLSSRPVVEALELRRIASSPATWFERAKVTEAPDVATRRSALFLDTTSAVKDTFGQGQGHKVRVKDMNRQNIVPDCYEPHSVRAFSTLSRVILRHCKPAVCCTAGCSYTHPGTRSFGRH